MKKNKIASILIRLGCNINFCDPRMNLDNLDIARRHNNIEICKILIFAGYDLRTKPDIIRNNKQIKHIKTAFDWLVYTKYNPLSLMDLCRIKIRRRLGKKVFYKIPLLGLPRQLVSFLNIEYID